MKERGLLRRTVEFVTLVAARMLFLRVKAGGKFRMLSEPFPRLIFGMQQFMRNLAKGLLEKIAV